MIEIELPYPKIKTKKSYGNLSLNLYRTAHYFSLNTAKKKYEQLVFIKLKPYKKIKFDEISITYTLFCKNHHRRDLSNFLSVVDKFVSDTIVDVGIIKDDDLVHLKKVIFQFGGYEEDKIIVKIKGVDNGL